MTYAGAVCQKLWRALETVHGKAKASEKRQEYRERATGKTGRAVFPLVTKNRAEARMLALDGKKSNALES